jgi:hypothetical protein
MSGTGWAGWSVAGPVGPGGNVRPDRGLISRGGCNEVLAAGGVGPSPGPDAAAGQPCGVLVLYY